MTLDHLNHQRYTTSTAICKIWSVPLCTHLGRWSQRQLSSGKRPSKRRWLGSSPWNTGSQIKTWNRMQQEP